MKTLFLCLLTAALLAGCAHKADPAPTPAQIAANNPDAPWATYTDAAGVTVALNHLNAGSVTAPPFNYGGPDRRAVIVQGMIGDKLNISLSYYYSRSVFPTGQGRLPLDAPVLLVATSGVVGGGDERVEVPGSATAYLDIVGVNTVSAAYTGPMKPGGPNVTIIFNHLSF